MATERDWPQATKHSVEKVEKDVKELQKRVDKAEKDAVKITARLDKIQEVASAAALVTAVRDIATSLNKKPFLTQGEAIEIRNGLAALVGKLQGVGLKPGQVARKGEINMAVPTIDEFRALLADADAETNRIAQRITDLMNSVVPGLTEADANEIKAGLQAEVDKLKGVGVVP